MAELPKIKGFDDDVDLLVGEPKDTIFLNDIREKLFEHYLTGGLRGSTTYIPQIDEIFLWSPGMISLFIGIPSHGKTTALLYLTMRKSMMDGTKWAFFSPEQNPPESFYATIMGMYIGAPCHPSKLTARMSENQFERAAEFVAKHYIYIYPEDETPTPQHINERFEECIVNHGVKGCITDPFNQLDNDWQRAGGRDLYVSSYCSLEKRFALKHQVYKITVAHPNKMTKQNDGNYERPNFYDINGGSVWSAKMDQIMCIHRPNTLDYTDSSVQFVCQKAKNHLLHGKPGEVFAEYDYLKQRYLFGSPGSYIDPLETNTPQRIDFNGYTKENPPF
jgi:hypothetical protein